MHEKHALPFIRGTFMGIDPSLNHTGICILDQYEVRTFKIEPKNITGVERLRFLKEETMATLATYAPSVVVIEGYAHGKANRAHQIGEWGGVLRMGLFDHPVGVYEVAPATLKKFVCGNGGSPKSAMMLNLFKRWGLDIPDEDEADAAGLAMVGAYLRSPDLCGPTLPQREALQKVNILRPAVRLRERRLQRAVKRD